MVNVDEPIHLNLQSRLQRFDSARRLERLTCKIPGQTALSSTKPSPRRVPAKEMLFLDWPDVTALADAHSTRFRTLIYLAVDSGTRWSERLHAAFGEQIATHHRSGGRHP